MRSRTDTRHVPFRRSLQAKVVLGVLLALVLMLVAVIATVYVRGYELLESREHALAVSATQRVAGEIGVQLALAQGVAASMANLGERLPHDEALWRDVLPNLIDLQPHADLIAGGGLWPEPDGFTPGVARRSFFWGRDESGQLRYFDNYNDPKGAGYHREEWYVPARELPDDRCYWSRSYQDPYTGEPMVTCTVAMRRDGAFAGVSTIDLRLAGLQDFLAERGRALNGYAFAVDRNGVFVTAPPLPGRAIAHQRREPESLQALAERLPDFAETAALLLRNRDQGRAEAAPALAQQLDKRSEQVGADEALRIAAQLLDDPQRTAVIEQARVKRDPFLGEAALVTTLRFPDTHWQLAVVQPVRLVHEAVLSAMQRVMWTLGLVIVLVTTMAGWMVRRTLVAPIRRMAQELSHSEHDDGAPRTLAIPGDDELGQLASKFNEFARELADSHSELQASAEQFRAVTELAHDALIQVDGQGRIRSINRAGEQIFGWREDELLGRHIDRLVPWEPPAPTNESPRESDGMDSNSRAATRVFELNGKRRDGSEFPAELSASFWRGPRDSLHNLQVRDVTERRRNEEQTRQLATHDGLTGLPNRALFNDRLRLAVESSRRDGSLLALLFLDLDHFKVANDSLGHSVGDALLRAVSQRLQACVRGADTVARLGGDEFGIVLPTLDGPEEAALVAQRVLDAIEPAFDLDGQAVQVGVSIGATLCPIDDLDADQLLRKADMAMYHAKAEGRNTFRFYTTRLHAELLERKALLDDISRAIGAGEFVLHYQPILDVGSGQLHGMEALVRWQHPVRGLVGPDQFIPAAEQSGLIINIGHWVIEQALRDLARWDAEALPPVHLAINLSLAQFCDPALVGRLQQALLSHGSDPARIELELTETVLMHDLDGAIATMQQLRALGVGLAVDDFGTGYSSLSYLKRFPVQKLKIDKSFVSGVATESDTASICRSVIALGHNLGLRVVGEGVESLDEQTFLREQGCDYMQGYLFSRPRPLADIQTWLRARPAPP